MVLAVPSPATTAVGQYLTSAFWNTQVRDAVTFLLNPPHFVGVQVTTTDSIGSGLWGPVHFDSNVVDSYTGHSTVTNNSRYTAQVAGWYECSAVVAWAGTSTAGSRIAAFAKNGTRIQGTPSVVHPSQTNVTAESVAAREVFLAVNDYVELVAYQDTGANLSTYIGTDIASSITVRWVHV